MEKFLSPSDRGSDPEEKEFSDDDDDRNHKHRRRETRSQSSERDALEQVLTRPYRKRNKPFENGHSYRESYTQPSETWKNYNIDKRRPGVAPFPRANQLSSGEPLSGRGRGREYGSWSQRDSRFNSVDIASRMVQPGSVPPGLFAGRGYPNAHSASLSPFGLIPVMPNGGLDTLHSFGLQGTTRPTTNPSLGIGIPRQRCRDFEERGFCLRGDMCPMEHGVNRIVVEDVQSLSQFNLPVSLPSAHLLGAGPLSSVGASSSSLMNSKVLHGKHNKTGMAGDGLGLNGAFTGSAGGAGPDVYDPDQPLWTNERPETSSAPQEYNPSKFGESEPLLDAAVGSQSSNFSVWGRIGSSKNRSEMKEKIDPKTSTSTNIEDQGKRINAEDSHPQDSSLKLQGDTGRFIRKPSQKALRTLFVNGIPQNNNKREALLSHFRKFGEVIDIYIPPSSDRAFVQFSKREEAEAALKAPDAVMGNRFIKLWWANRDRILDDGVNNGYNTSLNPRGMAVTNGGKDNLQSVAPKVSISPASVDPPHASDNSKAVATNSPKAAPPLQKKLDNLELLKEELRKKQEMLDQKRNDFKRQLNKLERQASGIKGEVVSEQAAKRHKVGTLADVGNAETPKSTDSGIAVASPWAEVIADKNKSAEIVVHLSPKTNSNVAPQESSGFKPSIRPLAPLGAHLTMNRFKLDNRPTAFKIIPPLPTGLANVAVLKEHFSIYGNLSTVELEESESDDSEAPKTCAAHISFTTRRSAERAFASGKSWQGHDLQFTWLTSNSTHNVGGGIANPSLSSKEPSGANLQLPEVATMVSQEAVDSGNEKSENLERTSDEKLVEGDEDLKSSSSMRSSEEQSPKGDGY